MTMETRNVFLRHITVKAELDKMLADRQAVWAPDDILMGLIARLALRADILEARVRNLETWKRPRFVSDSENSSHKEGQGVPSDEVSATSIPPEKENKP